MSTPSARDVAYCQQTLPECASLRWEMLFAQEPLRTVYRS